MLNLHPQPGKGVNYTVLTMPGAVIPPVKSPISPYSIIHISLLHAGRSSTFQGTQCV